MFASIGGLKLYYELHGSGRPLSRRMPNARLAILPCGHGEYLGEIEWPDSPLPALVMTMIDAFLDK